jgi:cell wall-associated protease
VCGFSTFISLFATIKNGVMRFFRTIVVFVSLSLHFQNGFGQSNQDVPAEEPAHDWFLLDPDNNKVQGISIERTYRELLANKPARKVIVAVIDTGVDIDHEDLKNNIWKNEGEAAGNGIDDDKNGYVDDVHGWNFIGGKAGNVVNDHTEATREYIRLKPLYEKMAKPSKKDKAGFAYWETIKKKYENDSQANQKKLEEYDQQFNLYATALFTISYCDSLVKKKLNIQSVSLTDVETLNTTNDTLLMVQQTLQSVFENMEKGANLNDFLTQLEQHVQSLKEYVDDLKAGVLGYDVTYNPRTVVGDNQADPTEKQYGNNDVSDPSKHGTHVAGIIAADRTNTIGVKGVADHVLIMPIKVVPASGDERDKDVANGILYAVDNGAQIINMSFGKHFSPNKEVVENAIRYAEKRGVLMIHAAGNDGDNIDVKNHYPVPVYANGKKANQWLEIGASSWGEGENLVADFSNYGKNTVDVFAPGVSIYSTTPSNEYESLQGTSMASPVVAGVAATLMAYFPTLSATDIANIIRQSSRKFDNLKVTVPGGNREESLAELSATGGIVNAYEAVKLAANWKPSVPKK